MEKRAKRELREKYAHARKIRKMEIKAKRKECKTSGTFMNCIVVSMMMAALCFTVAMSLMFSRTGSEPSTLIDNVFRFLSVEGGAMALIKSVKTVTKKKSPKEILHEDEPE